MAQRISKKPKVSRQYELSQQKIIDNAVDFGGAPDVPATSLSPDNRPNINRGDINSKNDSKANPIKWRFNRCSCNIWVWRKVEISSKRWIL